MGSATHTNLLQHEHFSVLSRLEPKGSDLAIAYLEASEEAISGDRGFEASDREAVEVDSEDEKVPQMSMEGNKIRKLLKSSGGPITNVQEVREAHPFIPPTSIQNPPSPSL